MDTVSSKPSQRSLDPQADHGRLLAPLLICFFLSGFAALIYQTAWLRQFSTIFGTSELAVATVLAAYMGGLAIGAALAARYLTRVRRPVLLYGLLEGGIALSALAVPFLLAGARALYVALLGDQPLPPSAADIGQPIFYLLVAFAVLALPTAFMGATLPLLTRHLVRADAELGPRVAGLYATNTAGAVCGTVVAGFLLLPALGLAATVWVGVGINALVFAVAAGLARRAPGSADAGPAADGQPRIQGLTFVAGCIAPLRQSSMRLRDRIAAIGTAQPAWILPLMLLSGANAFLYEVLWTRLLTHVIGGSVFAFSTMLAAFLSGIALGGGLATKFAMHRERAALAFAGSQIAIAVASIGIYAWMSLLIPAERGMAPLVLYAIAVLLPATIFIGATFPLAVRILARDERDAGGAAARIYAWNTVGAIAGAILAGFVLIPRLGFEDSIRLAVLVNLGIAAWTTLTIVPRVRLQWTTCALALLATLLLYHPLRPEAVILQTGSIPDTLEAPSELFYGVGRSSTVLLLEADGRYHLRTNGLPEASIVARGGLSQQDATKWLAALPALARPGATDLMLIGFGGGVAIEGVPPSIQRIDVIELEPRVIEASRVLAGRRDFDPLADPRLNLVINDARNALRLTRKTYDIIVSQPSHPWTAGASHLFTREFFAEAKRHLNRNGVFVQWMNSEYLDETLLRGLSATLLAEFEHVRLYQPASQVLVFLASAELLDVELELARTGEPLRSHSAHYARLGIAGIEDLLAALMLDEIALRNFTGPAPISTDDRNLMAMASRADATGLTVPDLSRLFAPHDPLLKPASWVHTRLGNRLSFSYLARRLVGLGQLTRVRALTEGFPEASTQRTLYGLLYEVTGQLPQAYQAYLAALRANPANLTARYQLVAITRAARGIETLDSSEELRALTGGLQGPAAAVLTAWRHHADRDWRALASLDTSLAASRVTDIWYPDAVRLRAEWRLHVNQDQARFAAEALQLIDRGLLIAPSRDLASLRLVAALLLEDLDLIIEAARSVVRAVELSLRTAAEQALAMPAASRAAMTDTLRAILEQLEAPLLDPQRDRATRLADAVRSALATLEPSTPP